MFLSCSLQLSIFPILYNLQFNNVLIFQLATYHHSHVVKLLYWNLKLSNFDILQLET